MESKAVITNNEQATNSNNNINNKRRTNDKQLVTDLDLDLKLQSVSRRLATTKYTPHSGVIVFN